MAREGREKPIQSIEITEVTAVGRCLEQCLAWLKLEKKKRKRKRGHWRRGLSRDENCIRWLMSSWYSWELVEWIQSSKFNILILDLSDFLRNIIIRHWRKRSYLFFFFTLKPLVTIIIMHWFWNFLEDSISSGQASDLFCSSLPLPISVKA